MQLLVSMATHSVSEETFWRNYFYRVSLIRQSADLSSMARSGSSPGTTPETTLAADIKVAGSPVPIGAAQLLAPEPEDDLSDAASDTSFAGDDLQSQAMVGVALDELGVSPLPARAAEAVTDNALETAARQVDSSSSQQPLESPGQPSGSIPEWEQVAQQ